MGRVKNPWTCFFFCKKEVWWVYDYVKDRICFGQRTLAELGRGHLIFSGIYSGFWDSIALVCVCVCLYVSMCACVCLCVCRLQGFGGSELLSSFVRRSCSVPRRPSHRQLLKNTPRRKYKKYLATAEELYLKDIPKGWKPSKYDISLSNCGWSVIRTGKPPGSATAMDGKVFWDQVQEMALKMASPALRAYSDPSIFRNDRVGWMMGTTWL